MKIKKHLVAATVAVGLAGSAAAMSPVDAVAPGAEIGFILAYKATQNSDDDFVKGAAAAVGTAAGGAAGGLAMVWAGAKIGGSFGAFVGGPFGIVVGTAGGAL